MSLDEQLARVSSVESNFDLEHELGLGLGGGGRSQRLKGLPMSKSVSLDLVSKVHKQMRRLQGHFLIAALAPLSEAEQAQAREWDERGEQIISYDVVNTRQAMLHYCQAHGLQFSTLRYAQYSTMMLLYEMLHPGSGAISAAPSYCLPSCSRGRVDDGSIMLGCDFCDNWFHPACLQQHMPDRMPDKEDTFICPMCFEAQAEMADVMAISDNFLDGFAEPDLSGVGAAELDGDDMGLGL